MYSLYLVVVLVLATTLAMGQAEVDGSSTRSDAAQCVDLEGHADPCPDSMKSRLADDANPSLAAMRGDARDLLGGFWQDQGSLWTSPLRVKLSDAKWLVPVAGITAGLVVTDRTTSHEMTRWQQQSLSNNLSNAGLSMLGLTAGSLYFLGRRNGDDREREAGLLATQSALDALSVEEIVRYAFRRDYPYQDSGRGQFLRPGGASFPSSHAAVSFSIATVIAQEYPNPWAQLLAYGVATGVSLSRVSAQQHFPADVFVGGALGYLIGRNVYRKHHQPAVETYGTFEHISEKLPAASRSSTYIELDSWIYPAIERLAAEGKVNLQFQGLRPWTRMAVYQMLEELSPSQLDRTGLELVTAIQRYLKQESELDSGAVSGGLSVDRIYTRTQYISGTPLNDGYHFGQTLADDFGRPYARGVQQITGFESRAETGRFSFFARGEYQHSPSIPADSAAMAQTIAMQDATPVQTFAAKPAANAYRLLDTYASFKLSGTEISVGKQSYWWGPDVGSALLLSNNAEPFYSLRINRTSPWQIPYLSKLLGPARYDSFFGRLSGHQFPPRPFFWGQKISFRPSENLELGFSRDAVFAGQGVEPLTFGTFFTSFTSANSGSGPGMSPRTGPGARHGNFDFSYRLPWLRDWVTLYCDSLVHDDVSPISAPRRAAVIPGLYFARIPGVRNLDLHVEGGTTDTVTDRKKGGSFYYWERFFPDGYTNKGHLLGTWLGREGIGGQAWATYWFGPRSTFQIGFRTVKVSQFFVPQGEMQQDGYAELNYRWQNGLELQVMFQAERWVAPLLATSPQFDSTTRLQLSFTPRNWKLVDRR